jgi:hypothetical protein
MLKISVLLFFVLFSLSGLCQEGDSGTSSSTGGTVTIRESAPTAEVKTEAEAPVFEEDEAIRELNATREAQLKKANLIQSATKPLEKPMGSPFEDIKALGHQQLNAAALMDEKVLAIFQKLFTDGHFSKVPRAETLKFLSEKVKGSFWEKVFIWFPVLKEIAVEVIRDPKAMPGLMQILVRKDDLKTYGYIWLAIFVFGIFIKGRIVKPKWPFLKRRLVSLTISIPLTLMTFGVFYNIFSVEIDPLLGIIAERFQHTYT